MTDPPQELNALAAIRDHYARFGLAWESAESGSAIGRIVLNKPRRGLQRATALSA
jgi:hypothetical protein